MGKALNVSCTTSFIIAGFVLLYTSNAYKN